MAQRQKKQVDSNEVRKWANDNGWRDELDRPVADRGRMPSGLIDAYNKANARYNREYVPIPRPVRADYRDQAEADRAEKAKARETRQTEKSQSTKDSDTDSNSGGSRRGRRAAAAAQSAPVVASAPATAANTDSMGVQSLQDVIAFLTAAENKKGTRQAVVTIQTIVNV